MTGEFVLNPLPGWTTTLNYTYAENNISDVTNFLAFQLYDAWGELYWSPAWYGNDPYARGRDALSRRRIDDQRHTFNLFTQYDRNIGNHFLSGMVGFSQELLHFYELTASSGNMTLFSAEIPTFGAGFDGTHNINEPQKNTLATRGVFGRINYNFNNRYLVELNARYDGSSRFLRENRFQLYTGVSGAWNISEENFWEPLRQYVNFLRLRGSYGSLGDQGSVPGGWYPFFPIVPTTSPTGTNWFFDGRRQSHIGVATQIVNPNLTWVTSTTVGFGVDATAFRNRLTMAFDWYDRISSDIIGPPVQLPAVLGSPAPRANNAELQTKGFELSLAWRDRIQSIGLTYGVRATLADSRTYVLSFPNETKTLGTWFAGARMGDIWGFETERFFLEGEEIDQNRQGNPLGVGSNWQAGDIKYRDLNGDGLITRGENTFYDPGDRRVIGNSLPRYTFGLTLDAAWRNFDVSVFVQGVGKRDVWLSSGAVGNFWGIPNTEWQANLLTIHRDRWTPETPDGFFPRFYTNNAGNSKNQHVQTKFLQDASYARLKNLQIGYTLPASLLNRAGIERARLFVSGENLATITNFVETIDPELGHDRGLTYPLQRTWSVGLNLSF
jgi:TonB-linked SusC/RagA family outer membrane protein